MSPELLRIVIFKTPVYAAAVFLFWVDSDTIINVASASGTEIMAGLSSGIGAVADINP